MTDPAQPVDPQADDSTDSTSAQKVVCPPDKEPTVRRGIVAAMFIGAGIWTWIDAHKYPQVAFSEDLNAWLTWAFNYYGRFIFLAIGIAAAAFAILHLRRTLVADEEGIGYDEREKLAWENVDELDASDLADKQILRLRYGDGKTLKLDKYKLQNFRELVSFVEGHVPDEKKTT